MSWGYRCQYMTPSAGTMTIVAPAAAVLHVRTGASRSAPWRGRSPLSGAMSDVELAAAASRSLHGEARVKNHVFLHPPQSDVGGHLTADQIDTLTAKVAQTPNGKTILMSETFQATRTRPDPSQGLDEARRTSCMEIAAACGVPPVLLQAGGDGNSAREAYRRLTRSTIEPLGRLLAHEASLEAGQPRRSRLLTLTGFRRGDERAGLRGARHQRRAASRGARNLRTYGGRLDGAGFSDRRLSAESYPIEAHEIIYGDSASRSS